MTLWTNAIRPYCKILMEHCGRMLFVPTAKILMEHCGRMLFVPTAKILMESVFFDCNLPTDFTAYSFLLLHTIQFPIESIFILQ